MPGTWTEPAVGNTDALEVVWTSAASEHAGQNATGIIYFLEMDVICVFGPKGVALDQWLRAECEACRR